MVTVRFSTTKAPFDWFALGANGMINNAPLPLTALSCPPPRSLMAPQTAGSFSELTMDRNETHTVIIKAGEWEHPYLSTSVLLIHLSALLDITFLSYY